MISALIRPIIINTANPLQTHTPPVLIRPLHDLTSFNCAFIYRRNVPNSYPPIRRRGLSHCAPCCHPTRLFHAQSCCANTKNRCCPRCTDVLCCQQPEEGGGRGPYYGYLEWLRQGEPTSFLIPALRRPRLFCADNPSMPRLCSRSRREQESDSVLLSVFAGAYSTSIMSICLGERYR